MDKESDMTAILITFSISFLHISDTSKNFLDNSYQIDSFIIEPGMIKVLQQKSK